MSQDRNPLDWLQSVDPTSRREFLKRAGLLGLSIPALSALLAACGGDEDDSPADEPTPPPADTPGDTPQPDDTPAPEPDDTPEPTPEHEHDDDDDADAPPAALSGI